MDEFSSNSAESSVARIFMSNFSRSSPQIASFFDESSTPLSCEGMDEESKRMNRSLDCPDTDYRPFRGVPHIFAGRYIREGMSGSFSRSSLSLSFLPLESILVSANRQRENERDSGFPRKQFYCPLMSPLFLVRSSKIKADSF